jgi:hypothetical protein
MYTTYLRIKTSMFTKKYFFAEEYKSLAYYRIEDFSNIKILDKNVKYVSG